MLVSSSFERSFEPGPHDLVRGFGGDHTLAERDDISVVMLTPQTGGFDIPTKRATDADDAIGHDLTIVPRGDRDAYPEWLMEMEEQDRK